jgi:ATP-dependent RNA helicase DeaD
MKFSELGLNPEIMASLSDLEFIEPTPVQSECIPFILESKKDLIALAQTGTGKTGAFGLPILNQIKSNGRDLQAIILCPTRELCMQISQDMKKFAKHSKDIDITAVYGGERIDIQIKALRKGTNIVVGTPGRVHDLIRRKILNLNLIEWLVLDEADEMLDMGFKDDLDAILEQTPKKRQTLLFSATISRSVHSIAKQYMRNAQEISIGQNNVGADNVSHEYYVVGARDRFEALKRILDYLPGVYGILFCRTRIETQEIADKLKRANYDTEALHGDISQNIRTKIMARFKRQKKGLLVATDVAARGIDVSNLSHVINYNLPDQVKGYTHRSGRTGRAKQDGVCISIVGPRDVRRIRGLESVIGKTIEHKQVPSGENVYKKQINNFIDDVIDVDIAGLKDEEYFSEMAKKFSKITKDDLIKHIVAQKFNHLIEDYKNARDINGESRDFGVSKPGGANVVLKINCGRKDGFDLKKLFSLINSNKSLKGLELGRINLMPEYTVFSVEKKRVEQVIKYLSGTKFQGKKISVVRDNNNSNQSERSRYDSGNRRSANKSRSGGRRSRSRSRSRKGRW